MEESPDPYAVVHTGTTIIAIACKDGVVFAADSRSTAGSYVSSRISDKIMQIAPNVFIARSGTTSHTQTLGSYAKYALNVCSVNSDTEIKRPVRITAQYCAKMIQNNKEYLSASLIVGGYDSEGPSLYQIPISGMILKSNICFSGSGSSYGAALADANYREDFDVKQATDFVINIVTGSIVRDGASGGCVNVIQITKEGTKRFFVKPKDQPFGQEIVKS